MPNEDKEVMVITLDLKKRKTPPTLEEIFLEKL